MENLGINYPIVGVPNFDPYPNDVLVMCGTITTHSITVSEKMLFFFSPAKLDARNDGRFSGETYGSSPW